MFYRTHHNRIQSLDYHIRFVSEPYRGSLIPPIGFIQLVVGLTDDLGIRGSSVFVVFIGEHLSYAITVVVGFC